MSSVRIISGTTEPITAYILSRDNGLPLSGALDLEVLLRRLSDGFFFDWNDNTFREANSVTDIDCALSETNATYTPGWYTLSTGSHTEGFNTSIISNPTNNDTYMLYFTETSGSDFVIPTPVEIKIDQWPANILDITGTINTNLNATVSSRAVPGDEMDLLAATVTGIVDSVLDEAVNQHLTTGSVGDAINSGTNTTAPAVVDVDLIVSGVWNASDINFITSGSMGFLQNRTSQIFETVNSNLDATVSSRAVPGDEMDLLAATVTGIVDSVLDEAVNQHLTTGSVGDAINSGSIIIAPAAVVDVDLIVSGVWNASSASFDADGTIGNIQNKISVMSSSIDKVRAITCGRWIISGSQMIFFDEDNITEITRFNLLDTKGDLFFSKSNAPAERVVTGSA